MTIKIKTEAAAMISCYDSKKKHDMYCKKLLSNKQILVYVMKGCTPEYADIPLEDIPSYIEMSSISTAECEYIDDHQVEVTDETIPRAQIKCDIQLEATIFMRHKKAGRNAPTDKKVRMIINLEGQVKDDPGYPLIERALYYCSRLMARQKHPKDGFQHSDYDRIKKVRSIWIRIGRNNQKNDAINTYKIQETCETKIWHAAREDYDLPTTVMVCSKKEDIQKAQDIPNAVERGDENKQGPSELLKILLIKNLVIEGKTEQLQKMYGILMEKGIDREVADMCNFSDFIEQRGKEEGKVEAALLHIKELMQKIDVSAVDAMNILGVEEDIWPTVLQSLHLSRKTIPTVIFKELYHLSSFLYH